VRGKKGNERLLPRNKGRKEGWKGSRNNPQKFSIEIANEINVKGICKKDISKKLQPEKNKKKNI